MSEQVANQAEPPVEAQRHAIRFGEFLAALDAIPAEKLATALKASKQLGIPLGRTLVVRRLLSNDDLGRLLEFHGLYRRGLCEFDQIRDAFVICHKNGLNVKEALDAIGCDTHEIESVRLGELLLAAEIIDVETLSNALSLQDLCGLPLGRVLSMHANVAQEIVDAALNYQTSIRQKEISYAEAVDKLKLMPLYLPPTNMRPTIDLELRDLLVAGKVCSDNDLQLAMNFAIANNLPLEKVLANFEWFNPAFLSATIGLRKLIQSGYITAHEAVSFLLNCDLSKKGKQTGEDEGVRALNLHKFLLASGYLTPDSIMEITKMISSRKVEFGEIIGMPIEKDTSDEALAKLLIHCFSSDQKLANVLIKMCSYDETVISHARNLVDLLTIGGARLEQALLSFAAVQRDLQTG